MIKLGCFIFVFFCLLLDAIVNGFRRCIEGDLSISNGIEIENNYSSVQCPEMSNNCQRIRVNLLIDDGLGKIMLCCN